METLKEYEVKTFRHPTAMTGKPQQADATLLVDPSPGRQAGQQHKQRTRQIPNTLIPYKPYDTLVVTLWIIPFPLEGTGWPVIFLAQLRAVRGFWSRHEQAGVPRLLTLRQLATVPRSASSPACGLLRIRRNSIREAQQKISRPCPLGKLRTSDLPRRKTCLGLGRVCRTQKPRSPQAYVPYVPYLPIQGSWGTQTKKARRPQAKKARAPQVREADRGFWKRQQLDLGMLRFSGFASCLRTVEPAPFHLSHKPA